MSEWRKTPILRRVASSSTVTPPFTNSISLHTHSTYQEPYTSCLNSVHHGLHSSGKLDDSDYVANPVREIELINSFAGVTAAVRLSTFDRVFAESEQVRATLISQMVLSTVGAAYGTAKAGIGIAGLGTMR